jgi:hypothetical protein
MSCQNPVARSPFDLILSILIIFLHALESQAVPLARRLNWPWRYSWNNGSHELVGKEFRVPATLVDALERLARGPFVELDPDSVRDFVFVTGTSSNHFAESLQAVARVQKFFPNHTILYYDLGLAPNQMQRVGIKSTQWLYFKRLHAVEEMAWAAWRSVHEIQLRHLSTSCAKSPTLRFQSVNHASESIDLY